MSRKSSAHSPPNLSGSSSPCLQKSAARGGGELRGSKSRRSSTQSPAKSKTQLTAQISAQRTARPKARPNSPPRVSITAAPLSLRRVCRRPLGFHLDFANAKRVKSLLRRAGDGFFARAKFFCAPFFVPPETALRGRRPGDPGGTERYYVSLNQLGPVLRCAPARFIYYIRLTAEIVESLL